MLIPSTYEAIRFHSRLTPQAIAVCWGRNSVNYERFCSDIEKFTRLLHSRDLPPAARVAVSVSDPYLHWLAGLALARMGMVTASTANFPGELDLLRAQVLVTDTPTSSPGRQTVVVSQDWLGTLADALPPFRDRRFEPDAPCRIVLSSGTTGLPKKILISCAELHTRKAGAANLYELNRGTRVLSTVGQVTLGGFIFPLAAWIAGGTAVLTWVPPGQTLAQVLDETRPNIVFMSPAQLAGLLDALPEGHWPWRDLVVYVGGSALPQAVNTRARLVLSQSLFVVYGSTEAGSVSLGHAATAENRPGFTGFVVPTAQVEIVDAQGQPLPQGEEGEVRIRTEGMAGAYLDEAPEQRDEAFRDGWFYPGDLGVLGSDGALSLRGRTRELMNLGGHKLAPTPIEEVLAGCPGVGDVAAFAVPHPGGTERLWVAVVAGAEFSDQELLRRYKSAFPAMPPFNIARIDKIPRNTMGKVLREDLRKLAQQAFARRHGG